MSYPLYTIEMAYARMRELQELANRSRAQQTARQHQAAAKPRSGRAKKR
ncbi:hypothetical protein [Streptomyces zagrosensis]|uniref:Uncharacterized protein n=1 Tax=Streptomyces zagrosensis TaxID=1042984 RepID=A0A7W9QD47_9ACTN|nr:hypothetical protein [Streptomyces zagrosensis]MBB5938030.1 hypothetical protein [Streptomyces zagrosensis]